MDAPPPAPAIPDLCTRSAGVLLHPTSLAGPARPGGLWRSAFRFADWLAAAGQSWWQMLPIGPTDAWNSPYQGPSAFAGNPLFIGAGDVGDGDAALAKEFAAFESRGRSPLGDACEAFRRRERGWLDDYALFMALGRAHKGISWTRWDAPLRAREPAALAAARRRLDPEIRFECFVQFLFERRWAAFRKHCRRRGIALLGDVPIYVAQESADVWAHPELFALDAEGRPTAVAGVPPDYFSKTGQRWGNPLYRWDRLRERGYDWWIDRLRITLSRFDAVRLDHFIGFHNYWEIPAGSREAREGRWAAGPGAGLFEAVRSALGAAPFVAEDLGVLTDEVRRLRDRFDLPGMRVAQFAFDGSPENEHLPHRYPRRCAAYTGTHDNNTARGWFEEDLAADAPSSQETLRRRGRVLDYLESDGHEIHWDLIGAVLRSAADLAIVPAQDLLGLGSEARMNRPGTLQGNWAWRLPEESLTDAVQARLLKLTVESERKLDLPPGALGLHCSR